MHRILLRSGGLLVAVGAVLLGLGLVGRRADVTAALTGVVVGLGVLELAVGAVLALFGVVRWAERWTAASAVGLPRERRRRARDQAERDARAAEVAALRATGGALESPASTEEPEPGPEPPSVLRSLWRRLRGG